MKLTQNNTISAYFKGSIMLAFLSDHPDVIIGFSYTINLLMISLCFAWYVWYRNYQPCIRRIFPAIIFTIMIFFIWSVITKDAALGYHTWILSYYHGYFEYIYFPIIDFTATTLLFPAFFSMLCFSSMLFREWIRTESELTTTYLAILINVIYGLPTPFLFFYGRLIGLRPYFSMEISSWVADIAIITIYISLLIIASDITVCVIRKTRQLPTK